MWRIIKCCLATFLTWVGFAFMWFALFLISGISYTDMVNLWIGSARDAAPLGASGNIEGAAVVVGWGHLQIVGLVFAYVVAMIAFSVGVFWAVVGAGATESLWGPREQAEAGAELKGCGRQVAMIAITHTTAAATVAALITAIHSEPVTFWHRVWVMIITPLAHLAVGRVVVFLILVGLFAYGLYIAAEEHRRRSSGKT